MAKKVSFCSRKKKNLFENRPKWYRSEAVVLLKNRIRKGEDSDLFYTHDVLDNSVWADILFLSNKNRFVIYNATIITHRMWIEDYCQQRAFDALYERVSQQDMEQEILQFTSFEQEYDANGRKLPFKRMIFPPEKHYPELGGLTRFEFVDQQVAKMLASEEPFMVPIGSRFLKGYAYGTGMDIVVESDELTASVIDAFIQQFRDNGEVPEQNLTPIVYGSNRIENWQHSNAIKGDLLDNFS